MAHPVPILVRRSPRLAIGVLALLGVMATPAAAQQAPAWPQFQGGPGHPGSGAAPAPPYRQSWRFSPPSGTVSGAVIDRGLAITVGTQAVYAIDLVTGAVAWSLPKIPGPVSTPAVATVGAGEVSRALLYLEGGSGEGSGSSASPSASSSQSPSPAASASASPSSSTSPSTLVAVDLRTRKELWRTPLTSQARSGVTVDGETAFVGEQDGTVAAVSLRDGAIEWTASAIGQIQTPPAAADGRVFVAARNPDGRQAQVLALDERSGQQAWEYLPPAGTAAASGLSAGDGLVVVGTSDRYVRGLDGATGDIRWASLGLSLYSPVAGPAYAAGTAVISDYNGGVYRIDPADGSILWDYQLNEFVVRSSPVLAGATALLGLNDGRLVGIDLASGHLVWESSPSAGLVGAIALAPQAVVAVKGGDRAGLIGFVHDPEAALIDVPSPSTLDPGKTLGSYAIALVVMGVVVFVPFRVLRSRIGPAFAGSGEADEDAPEEDP